MTTTIDPTALLEALVRSLDPSAQRELASELWRSAETTAPIVLKAASSAKSPHGVVLAFADVRPAVHLSCKDAARLAVTLARDAGEGDPLAPLRPAGVLGRGALTEAVPERVVEMVLERVNADRREIARLRAALAERDARQPAAGEGRRKRLAHLEGKVEDLGCALRVALEVNTNFKTHRNATPDLATLDTSHVRDAWALLATNLGLVRRRLSEGRPAADVLPSLDLCLRASGVIDVLTRRMHPDEEGPVCALRPSPDREADLASRLWCRAIELERRADALVDLDSGRDVDAQIVRDAAALLREAAAVLRVRDGSTM